MEELIQPVQFEGFSWKGMPSGPHANYKTPGCEGIMAGRYYKGTIVSSKNNYLKYPMEVEIKVWVFGGDGTWALFTVRDLVKQVWVTAEGARFENVVPIPMPEINP